MKVALVSKIINCLKYKQIYIKEEEKLVFL